MDFGGKTRKLQVTELSKCKECAEENQERIFQGQDNNKQFKKLVRSQRKDYLYISFFFFLQRQHELLGRGTIPGKKTPKPQNPQSFYKILKE